MNCNLFNQRAKEQSVSGIAYRKTWPILIFILLLTSAKLAAQTIDVSAKIISDNNESIPFATITLKETGEVIPTDANGEFTVKGVTAGSILIVSSIGYETMEYRVSKKISGLVIKLQRTEKKLEEVEIVNSGLQEIPKERVTGSFVKIDNNTLNLQTGTNILKRLDGVTSGLLFNIGKHNNNPQNKTNISIRGLSTINGPLDPLIVMDGFIYEGNIDNINPEDVESVTILKDATATSIWGARAGNGVIVITTKKARFNQKLAVSVNADVMITEKPALFSRPQMTSSDYIEVEEFLFNKGFFNSRINRGWQALTPAVEVFLQRRNGRITSGDSMARINALRQVDSRDQYNKYVYKNAVTQQYSISLRGGSAKNSYGLSISYDDLLGNLQNTNRKLNLKLDNSFRPFKNMDISLSVYYTGDNMLSGIPGYKNIRPGDREAPYYRLADENGTPLSVPIVYRDTYTDTAGAGKLLDWKFYPLEDYKHLRVSSNQQDLFSIIGVRYKLFSFLDFSLKYQYGKQESQSNQESDLESFNARNMINLFSQLDRNTGVLTYIVPVGAIRNIGNTSVESQTTRGQFDFNKNWRLHSISAIAGAEIRQTKSSGTTNTVYGYNDDPLKTTTVDFVNSYRTFVSGAYQSVPGGTYFSGTASRFVSLYTNLSYTYKSRYIVSASARRDGSNIFGVNTNDRWKPLWSVGSAWNLSKEKFYHVPAIPVLKLRMTYGYSGNVDLSRSAVLIGRSYPSSSTTNLPYTRVSTINNPELRWEKSGQLNIGADFSVNKDILSGSIEYYIKKGTDLYGIAPYDYTTWGFASELTRNVADMKGHGVDIVLNSKNINKPFKWETTLLLNYNTDKTTDYKSKSAQSILSKLGAGSGITPVVGKPLYSVAAYKWGGLDAAGNPQGFVDGVKSSDYLAIANEARTKGDNVIYVGPSNPVVYGSLINSFALRNFLFSINISYKAGYYFQKPSISYNSLISTGAGDAEFSKRWQNPGDEAKTNVPSFIYPNDNNRDNFYLLSEVNVLKADHIRIQYINLDYSFKSKAGTNSVFKDIRIYANASNLGILWRDNNAGLDPDYPYDFAPSTAYTFGFRANF